jgi:type III secretion protein U
VAAGGGHAVSGQKTEKPTPRRIRKAREDGQVAHSKDLTQTVLIIALFIYMLAQANALGQELAAMMVMPAGLLGLPFDAAVNALLPALTEKGIAMLAPFLGIVIGLGLLVEWWQTGMLISFKALAPSGKKLDIAANAKNIFSGKNFFEFVKSTVKIVFLSVLVYAVLRSSWRPLVLLPTGGIGNVGAATEKLVETLLFWLGLGYVIISAADHVYQQRRYIKDLMMTREEVDRDHKEGEGDPHIKQKRKELHRELLEHQAVRNTRNASVVVTNPTHLAVAILYEKGLTPLPLVLAKGEGALAHEMTRIARAYDIPVMQNIPLARALTAQAEIDQYIPSELIEPVAELLRAVRHAKGGPR